MSTFATRLQSRRFQRRFFWIALVVLVGGGIAAGIVLIGNKSGPTAAPLSTKPATDVSKVPKTVKLAPEEKLVAQEFILTAVARQDLAKAYTLVGPAIKQGQSLKSWLTGDIAVVPYPVKQLDIAPMKIDYSYATEASIQVALLPKKGSKVKPQLFQMTLDKIHGRWVVNAWVPRSSVPVPCGDINC